MHNGTKGAQSVTATGAMQFSPYATLNLGLPVDLLNNLYVSTGCYNQDFHRWPVIMCAQLETLKRTPCFRKYWPLIL